MIKASLRNLLDQFKGREITSILVQSKLGMSSQEVSKLFVDLDNSGEGMMGFRMVKGGVFAETFLPFSSRSESEVNRRRESIKAKAAEIRSKVR